jgi:cell division protein FtsZ
VHEPAMQGEIRVTVIATGFDKTMSTGPAARTEAAPVIRSKSPEVIPFPQRVARGMGISKPAEGQPARRTTTLGNTPTQQPPQREKPQMEDDLTDMEIPTFIRRQMD